MPRLLEGEVTHDERDPFNVRLEQLEQENTELRDELRAARAAIDSAKREATRALGVLRRQLNPLYRALQSVFGELDAAGIDDGYQPATSASPRVSAVWENWKSKLGAGPAKCIDALLLHGELSTQQLSVATGYHRNTVPQYVSALHKNGLITKNNGRFALKQL